MNNKLYDASAAKGPHIPALASGAVSQDNNGSQTSSESAKREAASQNSPGILKGQEFRRELQSLYGKGPSEAIFDKITKTVQPLLLQSQAYLGNSSNPQNTRIFFKILVSFNNAFTVQVYFGINSLSAQQNVLESSILQCASNPPEIIKVEPYRSLVEYEKAYTVDKKGIKKYDTSFLGKTKDQAYIPNGGDLLTPPPVFNSKKSNIAPKDFATIFNDANLKLYNDKPSNPSQIESPAGVSKYLNLGVDLDRPSIILNMDLNKSIYNKDNEIVYDQLVLSRHFRLENIFESLNDIDPELFEDEINTYEEAAKNIEKSVEALNVVSSIDDDLMKELIREPMSIAVDLGFPKEVSLDQAYIQTLYDIGAAPVFGAFYKPIGSTNTKNIIGKSKTDVRINSNHDQGDYAIPLYRASVKDGIQYEISDPSLYMFGNTSTYLGYHGVFDSTVQNSTTSGGDNLGHRSFNLQIPIVSTRPESMAIADVMNSIYYELVLSKLYTSGDASVVEMYQSQTNNISETLFGNMNLNSNLNELPLAKKLTSILKYNYSGENYYPFRESVEKSTGISGRTFFESIVQPSIGTLIEGEEPDFDLLDRWIENSNSELNNLFQYTDIFNSSGGAPIVLNEILLGIIDLITDYNKMSGAGGSHYRHPHSNSMHYSRAFREMTPTEIMDMLNVCIPYFGDYTKDTQLGHIYNTFGFAFFENIHMMVADLGLQLNNSVIGENRFGDIGIAARNLSVLSTMSPSDAPFPSAEWNPLGDTTGNYPTDRTSANPSVKTLYMIYEEFSRLFNLIENGIMTSIELLLANEGLIKNPSQPDYLTPSNGFFVSSEATIGQPLNLPIQPGNYEATAFSGIPRIALRSLLAQVVWKLSEQINLFNHQEGNLAKVAKVAVENLDATAGPVRWKVTTGQWPPASKFTDISDDIAEKLIPVERVELSSENSNTLEVPSIPNEEPLFPSNSSGGNNSTGNDVADAIAAMAEEGRQQMQDQLDSLTQQLMPTSAADRWPFINSLEGFCPITLMLPGELDESKNLSYVAGNRSILNSFFSGIIDNKTKTSKMKQLLTLPVQAYQVFPDTLNKSVSDKSLDTLKEIVKLPDIDGQELVRFANDIYIANCRKTLMLEKPSITLKYLPNKYLISIREYQAARAFIKSYIKNKSRPDLFKIQAVGIPSGYLSSIGATNQVFNLTREANFLLFPKNNWTQKTLKFHPEIYLVPGSLSNCDKDSSFINIVEKSKYLISNKSDAGLMSYSQVAEYLEMPEKDIKLLLINHVLDYSIQLSNRVVTGLNVTEDTFRLNSEIHRRYIADPAPVEKIIKSVQPEFLNLVPEEDVFDNNSRIIKDNPQIDSVQLNTFLGCIDSRLISSDDIARKTLAPRIFDRVFSLLVHPTDHYTTMVKGIDPKGLEPASESKIPDMYKIAVADNMQNYVKNDHFATYFYRIEK